MRRALVLAGALVAIACNAPAGAAREEERMNRQGAEDAKVGEEKKKVGEEEEAERSRVGGEEEGAVGRHSEHQSLPLPLPLSALFPWRPPRLGGSSSSSPPPLEKHPVTHDFSADPGTFTAAFDGSLRFSLWLRTMRFARAMKAKHQSAPRFTYFVNAAFYSTEKEASDVGRATSRAEILVRRALTQQAINEGHDIADHGFGHHDGSQWTREAWASELDRFHRVMDFAVFEPIVDGEGRAVFPRFEPLAGAGPGELGAACGGGAECTSGSCVELTATEKICSQPCNLTMKCPAGTACGAPMFREDTDLCLPPPRFPIELDGRVLFDARGEPNSRHPRLRRYAIVGFRAPYLGANDAMFEALIGRGYAYDTSQATGPAPPFWLSFDGSERRILEFSLMPWPGARAVPMDYSYRIEKADGARMQADYEKAVVASFAAGHWPWNIGHHFATWEDSAYLEVLEHTVDFVLSGCPDDGGAARCPGTTMPSFRELALRLAAPPRR